MVAALWPVLAAGLAVGGEPGINQLEGVVEFADSGQPAAGMPVVLVHRAKGYLEYDDEVGARVCADNEYLFGMFAKANGRYCCRAMTDPAGHFVLRNLAALEDDWLILAGDAEHGFATLPNIKPADLQQEPLRLRLEKGACLDIELPELPKGMRAYLAVMLAAPLGEGEDGASVGADEDADQRLLFYSRSLSGEPGARLRPIGPLPAGQRYKVIVWGTGANLPYAPVLFERAVSATVGETAEVLLQPKEGLTVAGRVLDADDKPLAMVNVQIHTDDGTVIGGLSDADGRYELHGLPPGTHTVKLLRHAKRTALG
jgi:hypothetical protein